MPKIVKRYSIKSDSIPGKKYSVAEWSNGKWSCSCSGWTRLKEAFFEKPNCKHIQSVKRKRGQRSTGDIGASYSIQNSGRKSGMAVHKKRRFKTILHEEKRTKKHEKQAETETKLGSKIQQANNALEPLEYRITKRRVKIEEQDKSKEAESAQLSKTAELLGAKNSGFTMQNTERHNLQTIQRNRNERQSSNVPGTSVLVQSRSREDSGLFPSSVRHFTVRMAWHDSKWNGTICSDPKGNYYCTGSHSLLSERIARRKQQQLESGHKSERLDALMPNYIPPCYWTSSAFSPTLMKIKHDHPFQRYEGKKIDEDMPPYSVFSWPFRLSLNHSKEKLDSQGKYPPDLPKRIQNLTRKFEPGESIVFFYLNYDNPISGEDEKYLLLGCAVVDKRPIVPGDFAFSNDEIEKGRKPLPDMKNFGAMNWAMNISYDFERAGILLPYQEYLDYVRRNPDQRQKLDEIKVLIEEESLVFGFKYVLADIDEDQCILLLTKLKRSIDIINSDTHGIIDFTREQELIDSLLRRAWMRRGLYPGLANVLNVILGDNDSNGGELTKAARERAGPIDLCDYLFDLIINPSKPLPLGLENYATEISELRKNANQYSASINLLKKLALFSLKRKQIENIIQQDPESFSKEISLEEIAANPYLLAEEYDYDLSNKDLDQEEILDGPIDLFRIDIGMFPDKVLGISKLQDLPIGSKERLRAIIIDYLYSIESEGDCYSSIEDLYNDIQAHPLFYKRELILNKNQLLSPEYQQHFDRRLKIKENDGRYYFYLREVHYAEALIKDTVTELLARPEYEVEIPDVATFLDQEVEILSQRVKNLDKTMFLDERSRLLHNVLRRSFFVVSGRPGSGKTKALQKILQELDRIHETATVLSPTGKATIRLKVEAEAKDAQTIDRFVYSDEGSYWTVLEDFSLIETLCGQKPRIQNLIIDESSMIDLQKLAVVFSMIELSGENRIKRLIMVGDENQLPPIGFGRPFYDIIQFLKTKPEYFSKNYVRLLTNCRQETDPMVVQLGEVFSEKNRYYSELLDRVVKADGDLSAGLAVRKWANRDELQAKIKEEVKKAFDKGLNDQDKKDCVDEKDYFNALVGLYPNGFVKQGSAKALERFQLLTPYRTDFFGSLGLSRFIRSEYKKGHWADKYFDSQYYHSEKVIRTANEYKGKWNPEKRRRELRLSNGSIGVINNKASKWPYYRMYYFTDLEEPLYNRGWNNFKEDEDLELAYAITVHKAQGSDFELVFLILPDKTQLLSKELLYTALTRSRRKITLFLKGDSESNVLEYSRSHSDLLCRNTSVFDPPTDSKEIFEPTKGLAVKSKIEYIIFKTLQSSGMNFAYEEILPLKIGPQRIKPDFTIHAANGTYFWEHLGELDIREYSSMWNSRRDWYKANGLSDRLITTDDLGGVRHEIIERVIDDIENGMVKPTQGNPFSDHHYRLYE